MTRRANTSIVFLARHSLYLASSLDSVSPWLSPDTIGANHTRRKKPAPSAPSISASAPRRSAAAGRRNKTTRSYDQYLDQRVFFYESRDKAQLDQINSGTATSHYSQDPFIRRDIIWRCIHERICRLLQADGSTSLQPSNNGFAMAIGGCRVPAEIWEALISPLRRTTDPERWSPGNLRSKQAPRSFVVWLSTRPSHQRATFA